MIDGEAIREGMSEYPALRADPGSSPGQALSRKRERFSAGPDQRQILPGDSGRRERGDFRDVVGW